MKRIAAIVLVLAVGPAIQSVGYLFGTYLGNTMAIISFIPCVVAAWIIGSFFDRRLFFVAGLAAAAVGYANGLFLSEFRVWYTLDVLAIETQSTVKWVAGYLALFAFASIFLAVIAAVFSALRNRPA